MGVCGSNAMGTRRYGVNTNSRKKRYSRKTLFVDGLWTSFSKSLYHDSVDRWLMSFLEGPGFEGSKEKREPP